MGGPLLSHSIHVPSIELSDDEYLVPDTGGLVWLWRLFMCCPNNFWKQRHTGAGA